MLTQKTGTREQWLKARLELLKAEKELTHRSDEVSRQRQELPWVPINKGYRFETNEGSASLAELFHGRSQLLVYHFMFGPSYAFRGRVGSLFLHALFGQISQGSDQLSNMNFTKFAWGFGGGLDVNVNDHLSMRPVELDYERTKIPVYGFAPGATQTVTGLRYAGGVVIKF